MMDFLSIHVFSMKEVDNSNSFAAGMFVKHSTHHNSFYKDKYKH
jgi:hypothetical protein